MAVAQTSSIDQKKILLSLYGHRMNLLRRDHHRQQYVAAFTSRNTTNYNDNMIMHCHRMRQLYSPICVHETRHCHEIANHYKDWCRNKIGRRVIKRAKRVVSARSASSYLPKREALQIPCFDYPRYMNVYYAVTFGLWCEVRVTLSTY